jgi:hypothetical protein
VDNIRDLTPTLRRLHLSHCRGGAVATFIPVLGHLTHVELSGYWDSNVDNPPFETILAHGISIESLRVSGSLATRHSAHFRRHPLALPRLREFGFDVNIYHCIDNDLFPAIIDFLSGRPDLEFLELLPTPPHSSIQVGFDKRAWDLMAFMPRLRGLSMTIPGEMSLTICAPLIPRKVRWLKLATCTFSTRSFKLAVRSFSPTPMTLG